ncbi:MAG: hypothetical protein IJU92_07635 [Spirochaetaceae bacterium]|nr:hypothetical protein [Spirochaetaceae bacterium]
MKKIITILSYVVCFALLCNNAHAVEIHYKPVNVDLEEVFLNLPDTVPNIAQGNLTKSTRQELFDAYITGKDFIDGETSISFFDYDHLSVYMSNGFGSWTLNLLPLQNEVLAIIITDRLSEDELQAFEFYIYKNGKATKTEKYGYATVKKALLENTQYVEQGMYDNVHLSFDSRRACLKLYRENWQDYFTSSYDCFAFSLAKKQFVKFDYDSNPIGQGYTERLEKLYKGFVTAFNSKDYLVALHYISDDALYEEPVNIYSDELIKFYLDVILSGNCVSGQQYFSYDLDFSKIKTIKVTTYERSGIVEPCLELVVSGKKILLDLLVITESIWEGVDADLILFTEAKG